MILPKFVSFYAYLDLIEHLCTMLGICTNLLEACQEATQEVEVTLVDSITCPK